MLSISHETEAQRNPQGHKCRLNIPKLKIEKS